MDCLAPEVSIAPEPSTIGEGSAGWLVGCGDEKAMAAAPKAMCGDADLREALGAAARKEIPADHSLEETVNECLRVFERLL